MLHFTRAFAPRRVKSRPSVRITRSQCVMAVRTINFTSDNRLTNDYMSRPSSDKVLLL
ncbi:uncharacterized protein PHALS_12756 [Plasmopara halstedii]|uniref:Uncharacterized protein n=1 Tax=Plasmopara halstedii TaxID=4781 RepID=A0A0P1ANW7_PLAHL|nr:uncharacterized protein PHALS_12756 [Plasmopara halstedii]CEG42486.1 hypothetical protein PHALS_12756 [Plasmopara halstedii]|eukprot:XP_024578855.1 hypothetical protein PHALS_12756 [Plasmopara halstedii]